MASMQFNTVKVSLVNGIGRSMSEGLYIGFYF